MEGYQNITKKFLEKARINMNEARDGLYLAYVQNEENKQAIAYFEGKERMAALREHIEQVTGRQVKIELKVVSKNSEAAQRSRRMTCRRLILLFSMNKNIKKS